MKGLYMHSIDNLKQLFELQLQSSKLHHAWIIEEASLQVIIPWLEDIIPKLTGGEIREGYFHPNLFWLKDTDEHSIESIRSLIHFLEKTSWDGNWKVAVVMGASELNIQSQGAILKIIEEPPEKSVIFLVSDKSYALLPTLYSRGLHIILNEQIKQEEFNFIAFLNDWVLSIADILSCQNHEKLFQLQTKLIEDNIDPETQAKWTLKALKHLIDETQGLNCISSSVGKVADFRPKYDWLHRWNEAEKYISNALFFNVDQKQFCVKLTTKILQ